MCRLGRVITTHIVLFHTLNTTSFEHFLRSNKLNYPSLHVKDLAMLLIKFYGEFCSFHRPVMPSLESQLNHGEFKSKSELQIKSWKK